MGWRRSNAVKDWPCTPDCPKRQPGCHSKCPDYAKAKEINDAKKAKIKAARAAEHDINGYMTQRISDITGRPQKQR